MKRAVLIIITVVCLLLAQVITMLATRAAQSATGLHVERLDFYYKQDGPARFTELKTQWQSQNREVLTFQQASELADAAYAQANMEAVLEQWRYHGGPSPHVFSAKAHVYSTGKKARLNVPVTVTVMAQVGQLRVNPAIQMTDFGHLEKTAQWERISQETQIIPAITPGEDVLLPLMSFRLLDFLAKHPNAWPTAVEVRISAPGMTPAGKRLALIPDHFVMPTLY